MTSSSLKTVFLLGFLSLIVIGMGSLVGGQNGLIVGFVFSLIMNVGAYFFSDKLALAASRAKPLSMREYPHVYEMAKGLSKQMDIPVPKLYLTPDLQANAFATGRSPSHASVALTRGIISQLSAQELQAVIAHEIAHIRNRDILIASIAAVMASVVSFVGNMVMWGGRTGDEEEGGVSPALGLLAALLMPITASLLQLAISREREYQADYAAARAMGSGQPLASALVAIHNSASANPMNINPAYASLFISNPLGRSGRTMINLFSTHPPVEERVRRLQSIN